MVVRLIVFLNSADLICQGMDISKCFRESLRLPDNESRLYLCGGHVVPVSRTITFNLKLPFEISVDIPVKVNHLHVWTADQVRVHSITINSQTRLTLYHICPRKSPSTTY